MVAATLTVALECAYVGGGPSDRTRSSECCLAQPRSRTSRVASATSPRAWCRAVVAGGPADLAIVELAIVEGLPVRIWSPGGRETTQTMGTIERRKPMGTRDFAESPMELEPPDSD